MKQNVKRFIEVLIFAIFFWSFVFCLFIIIRYTSIGEEQGIVLPSNFEVSILQWLDFGLILGTIVGVFYAIIEWLFEKYAAKKLYLGLSVLIKTILYISLLILSLSFIMHLAEYRMDLNLPNQRGWWKNNELFWITVGYFLVWSLVFSFIKIATESFGKSVFFNMMIGKYRKPTEERRIFMFLDLKSSTTIAENLGHFRYSQLIQDCFIDLNQTLIPYDAEVYQYVGDEAVLSWDYKKGLRRNNCINLFFAFQQRLEKRANYYQKKYNLLPEFKAGLHGGKLIVVEVGSIKKELAYHGDVINTTSRIQEQCNTYKEKFLISKQLLQQLRLNSQFDALELGNLTLKGKQKKFSIFALKKV